MTACFALCYERDARLGMQTFRLRVHVHNFNKLYKSAIQTQSEDCEIFIDIMMAYGANRNYGLGLEI